MIPRNSKPQEGQKAKDIDAILGNITKLEVAEKKVSPRYIYDIWTKSCNVMSLVSDATLIARTPARVPAPILP